MIRITKDQTVGEIVADMPSAAGIFREYGIDFCCGGGRKLEEAVKDSNTGIEEILEKLNVSVEPKMPEKNTGYKRMADSELIRHILDTHHAYMRKALPDIYGLSFMVLRAHGKNHSYLFDLHRIFGNLRNELEAHLIKEEEILFPKIRLAENDPAYLQEGGLADEIKETESEHDAAGSMLKELRRLTNEYALPDDACGTYAALFSGMKELEQDLHQHIHLENNILFRRRS